VEDGRLKIGDESVEVGDARAISNIVEGFHQTLVERDAREEKLAKQLEKAAEKNRLGEQENDRLRRENDELRNAEGSRISRAMMAALHAFFNLIEAVGELPDDEKAKRKTDDLKIFVGQCYRPHDAYGAYGVFVPLTRPDDREMAFIDRAIAEMDMEDRD